MLSGLAVFLFTAALPDSDLQVLDRFGRDVTQRGITLLDWEGHLANPAVKLTIGLPPSFDVPADLHISGTNARIHFDRSDPEDRTGIGKRVRMAAPQKSVDIHVSIFPDRDGDDERHQLVLQLFCKGVERSRILVPILVLDQDRPKEPPGYHVHLDFSEDRSGYFSSPAPREIVRQAIDDWSYFIADPGYEQVKQGDEPIQLWDVDGFKTSRRVVVPRTFEGYWMFISGIRHDELRAGGAPSLIGKFHRLHGAEQRIRRSGSVEFDTRGNWNYLGWFLGKNDEDWWKSGSLRNEPSDLYSIALHEMGHALAYHSAYPVWGRAKAAGKFAEPIIVDYHGQGLAVDASDHLPGTIDPVSLYGSFGNEYHGRMKARRWLITKSHLLALRAIGYVLRPIFALEPLSLAIDRIEVKARVNEPVTARVLVRRGVPDYRFAVVEGELPKGVALDEYTGRVSGKPETSGDFRAVVEVQDSDLTSKPVRAELTFAVRP